jgi:PBP1b-binding outer membrane lipoprotein LpoB
MKRFILVICAIVLYSSCAKDTGKTMNVTGNVKGLKKGTLYLQKIQDTLLVAVDSMVVDGDSNFAFTTELESPEVFYLYLNKKGGNEINDRITFFGEPGNININTELEFFEVMAKVEGSKTHQKLEQYRKMMSKFNERNLELIKANLEARKEKDSLKADSLSKQADRNLVRGYLYTLNFALTNKDSYIAPYIALSEAFDAKVKYLDTIYKSLTPQIADSKYGKKLKEYITKINSEEENP